MGDRAKLWRWYNLGVRALKCLYSSAPDGYVCPLCLRIYPPDLADLGELTLEHVPPDSIGGRELVLTCKPCNNTAGHTLEAQMLHREHQLDFEAGILSDLTRAQVVIGDHTQNAVVRNTEDGSIQLWGVPEINPPGSAESISEHLQTFADEGRTSGLKIHVVFYRDGRPRGVEVGWLRHAYLVMFARFGYRYAFSPALAPVRQQLADPDKVTLIGFYHPRHKAPKGRRGIHLVRLPDQTDAFLVVMGYHEVFLPGRMDDTSFYECLTRHRESSEGFQITSLREATWPTEPTHTMDLTAPAS